MNGRLDAFCRSLLSGRDRRRRMDPAQTAEEFVKFFQVSTCPRVDDIVALLRDLGITSVIATELPDCYRGIHASLDGERYQIEYEFSEWGGAQEHTLLHETYEIINERLQRICPGIVLPRGRRLCQDANRFAAAVLMQPDLFSLFAENSGLDVTALRCQYPRSYSSLTLRLTEIFSDQPLLAALYQREEDGEPAEWQQPAGPHLFRASLVTRTARFQVRAAPGSRLSRELPFRGRAPSPGSAVSTVITTGEALIADIPGEGPPGKGDGITVAARPVVWQGKLARIALVAVPASHRSLLTPWTPFGVNMPVGTVASSESS